MVGGKSFEVNTIAQHQTPPTFTDSCHWLIRVDGGDVRRAYVTPAIGGWSVEYCVFIPLFLGADNPRITWVRELDY